MNNKAGTTIQQAVPFDYIIVGAGSSGCVLADRLSADGTHRVLLLEAGSSHRHPFIDVPGASIYALSMPRFDWGFRTEPDPTRNGRTEHWPRGRLLGGSSSTNGMVFVRGDPSDYDEWAAGGATGWSSADLLPLFQRMETTEIGDDSYRGRSGPLHVQYTWRTPKLTEMFVAACEELLIPFNPDYNSAKQEGVAFVQASQRRGRRHSSARAFLDRARHRRNLNVLTQARATRILWEGKRAVGLEYIHKNATFCARVSREVILCAGAINSPQLLMLSGVGNANDLMGMYIEVVHALPAVGRNLMEHPNIALSREVTVRSLNSETGLLRVGLNGLRWLLTGSGPASSAGVHGVAFIRTRPQEARADIQLQFIPTMLAFRDGVVRVADHDGVTITANVSRPHSRGFIRLRSPDPLASVQIQPNLFGDERDLQTLVRGAHLIERIFATRAFGQISGHDERGAARSPEEWAALLRASAGVTFHPSGTCKMGTGSECVVDARLRVRGVESLRVADASVFPTLISGNTNAAALVIGEKAADLILDDARHA
ncbi:MAG: GMC family oxidoreductase N-terminal domain-containing protein [Steroidobacteraceae bacterium]